MATRKPTGPYTPPTEPTNIPEPKAAGVAVPVRTAPVQAPQEAEEKRDLSTDTGIMASDVLVAGTKQMRMAAENRRALIARRMEGLREDWQKHQEALTSLRQQGQVVVDEMNALSKEMDPIVNEHERLVAAIQHYDATLDTLGGTQ